MCGRAARPRSLGLQLTMNGIPASSNPATTSPLTTTMKARRRLQTESPATCLPARSSLLASVIGQRGFDADSERVLRDFFIELEYERAVAFEREIMREHLTKALDQARLTVK